MISTKDAFKEVKSRNPFKGIWAHSDREYKQKFAFNFNMDFHDDFWEPFSTVVLNTFILLLAIVYFILVAIPPGKWVVQIVIMLYYNLYDGPRQLREMKVAFEGDLTEEEIKRFHLSAMHLQKEEKHKWPAWFASAYDKLYADFCLKHPRMQESVEVHLEDLSEKCDQDMYRVFAESDQGNGYAMNPNNGSFLFTLKEATFFMKAYQDESVIYSRRKVTEGEKHD